MSPCALTHAIISWKSVLNLNVDPPQLIETRRIVATTDELDEIVVMVSAPKGVEVSDDERVLAVMEHGGRIVEAEHEPSGHSRYIVRLPKPLSLGERHTYTVKFTSYPIAWMKPEPTLLEKIGSFLDGVREEIEGTLDALNPENWDDLATGIQGLFNLATHDVEAAAKQLIDYDSRIAMVSIWRSLRAWTC